MNLEIIHIQEWESKGIPRGELLTNAARETAKLLSEKGIIEVIELKEGLKINSRSYVGKITLDHLHINIFPKLSGLPLYILLNYAFGLRPLKLVDTALHSVSRLSFFDLLIYELYLEAEDILKRGILKNYIRNEGRLTTPKGRIDLVKLSKQDGVIIDTLPCVFYQRDENHILNQIVLAGISLAIGLVADDGLKLELERIRSVFSETISELAINRVTLQKAKNSLNRLTERYSAILELINILYESQGIQFEDSAYHVRLRGYLLDMNAFFEALVKRLLASYSRQFSIKDQHSLHDMFIYTPGYNPKGRRSPTPRPDFALMKQGKVVKLLDAKYRDLWEKSLPRDMLYQLAVYAVSGIGDKTATILYPALDDVPTIQKIDLHDPISNSKMARVVVQPINLSKIAGYLASGDDAGLSKYISVILED